MGQVFSTGSLIPFNGHRDAPRFASRRRPVAPSTVSTSSRCQPHRVRRRRSSSTTSSRPPDGVSPVPVPLSGWTPLRGNSRRLAMPRRRRRADSTSSNPSRSASRRRREHLDVVLSALDPVRRGTRGPISTAVEMATRLARRRRDHRTVRWTASWTGMEASPPPETRVVAGRVRQGEQLKLRGLLLSIENIK